MKTPFTLRNAARIIIGWQPEEKVTSETAWLNGVRGLAAFLVLMAHYSWDYITFVAEAPFGAMMAGDSMMNSALPYRKGERLWAPWRLPILRVFISNGGGQVALFFVISGFVLTWSSLGLAQSENFSKLYTSLGSSTFRRWSRLFLPCVVVTYIYALQQDIVADRNVLLGFWTYLGEAMDWMNPFRPLSDNLTSALQTHNAVVWTIPYEFSGSIYVFVLVLILGRFRFSRRLPITILLAIGAFLSVKWHLWLFGGGMALADYARHAKLLARDQVRPTRLWQTVLWSSMWLLGMTLLGWPQQLPNAYTRPGYDLEKYIPLPAGFREHAGSDRFFCGLGALIVIASLCHLRLLRRFYETALLQHLGKISFMLYLIHIFVGGETGRKVQHAAYAALCRYDDEQVAGIAVCHINSLLHAVIIVGTYAASISCVFVAANILERFVDRPITKLGKIVDDLLLKWVPRNTVPGEVVESEEERLLDSTSLDELEMVSVESKGLGSESSTESRASSEQELPLHDRHVP